MDLFKKFYETKLFENGQEIFEKIAFCYIYPLEVKESNGMCIMPITSKSGKLVARIKGMNY